LTVVSRSPETPRIQLSRKWDSSLMRVGKPESLPGGPRRRCGSPMATAFASMVRSGAGVRDASLLRASVGALSTFPSATAGWNASPRDGSSFFAMGRINPDLTPCSVIDFVARAATTLEAGLRFMLNSGRTDVRTVVFVPSTIGRGASTLETTREQR
jgi:hypothetical protein